MTSIAAHVRRDRRQIRDSIMSVAFQWMNSQDEMLTRLEDQLASSTLAIFCDRLKWDESKQTMVLNMFPGYSREANTSSWNVMVQRRAMSWVDVAFLIMSKFDHCPNPCLELQPCHL